ncbi:hypothetical protein [Aquamicrobium sp. LC103]|uniref:hypothetical protein n=1 Tax=Aquamicrobium sp. LC103 TaxID=1120658 RepID=UPI00063EB926|nr:hypothetical protein [Aquamicrobium sp. LC103]TKT69463.1 hypothetical protein XW59_026990 [Aquamicrobium sp. LC103]
MPLVGKGIVAIWNDILPEMRDEFFEWHPREHMQERMGVPGFLRGRRLISTGGGEEFLTLYEASEPELLISDVYRKRLSNPTEWSLKVLPSFRNNLRGVCRIVSTMGYGDGGYVLSVRYDMPEDGDDAPVSKLIAPWIDRPRVTGVHLIRCDRTLSAVDPSLNRGRTISVPDRVMLIEGSTLEELEELKAEAETLIGEQVGASKPVGAVYRLEYQVMNYPEAG